MRRFGVQREAAAELSPVQITASKERELGGNRWAPLGGRAAEGAGGNAAGDAAARGGTEALLWDPNQHDGEATEGAKDALGDCYVDGRDEIDGVIFE